MGGCAGECVIVALSCGLDYDPGVGYRQEKLLDVSFWKSDFSFT